jgi:hypothetical protein
MNTILKISSLALLGWGMNAAFAQQTEPPASPPATAAPAKPPKPTAQAEAGEPRANTSAPASTAQDDAGEPRANTAAPAPTAQSEAAAPRAGTPRPAAANRVGVATGQKGPGGTDRLELSTATVTGDREQPKVMYIVPWKKSDIGDLAGKPMNSLVDEILAPIDRDVFKREVVYYKAVQADASQNGAQSRPSEQGEK